MTKKELKHRIKKRFKSLSNFARLGGFDRYRLQIVFAEGTTPPDNELQTYINAYNTLTPRDTGNVIDPEKLAILKTKIDIAGGVYRFCRDNPTFKMDQVYQVTAGKRKRNSDLVKRLFEFFKIDEPTAA
jgi:hypothetical protein